VAWNLSNINTQGTIEYAANLAGAQTVTARTYNNLVINRTSPLSTFTLPTTLANPCIADGNITVNTSLVIQQGVFVLTNAASVTRTHTVNGNVTIGSGASSATTSSANTALLLNTQNGATASLTIGGNLTVDAAATNGVMIALSAISTSTTSSTLTINGAFATAGSSFVRLFGNAQTSGNPSLTLNLRGNVTLGTSSRFVATRNPTATTVPTVILGGPTPNTVNVPVDVWWGSVGDEGNVRCNWSVPTGADVTLSAGSAIACMNTYALTLNGTLRCQDNSALIATLTGSATGLSNFVMGAAGYLTCADPQGLGDGTFLAPAPNQPLFVRQQAPSNLVPLGWALTSIASNGTVEFNGISTQNVDAGIYYNLVINNAAGNMVINFPETNPSPPPSSLGAPDIVTGNLTVTNLLDVQRGILVLTPTTGSAPLTHTFNAVTIGSAASTANIVGVPAEPPPLPQYYSFTTNTGIVVNNRANTSVTVTVVNDISSTTPAHAGVGFVIGGIDANSSCATAITVGGNFNFTQELFLIGSARGGGGTGPLANKVLQVAGNFTISNTASRFIGDWFGFVSDPRIRLVGTNATLTIPSVVWLGTKGETNALCQWEIPSGAQVTIPSGSALVCMNNRSVQLDGTLICEDGSEMISTRTGGSSSPAVFQMQSTGVLRIRDVHGLGTGTLLDPPAATAPVFIRRTAPFSEEPPPIFNWNLTSLNNNGQVIYDNNSATQAITPRNATSTFAPNVRYHQLVVKGNDKIISGGSVVVNSLLDIDAVINIPSVNDTLRLLNTAPASLNFAGGHVNGYLERAMLGTNTYLFPLGDGSLERQIELVVNATSATAMRGRLVTGDANVEVTSSVVSPLVAASFLRYYAFQNTGSNSVDVTQITNMRVRVDDEVQNSATNTTLKVATATPSPWTGRGPASVNTSVLPTVITSDVISPALTIGSNQAWYAALGTENLVDNPLPVELVEFVGQATGLGVELRWKTASERDNAGFVLLRNGQEIAHYRDVEALRGAGTLPVGRQYQFRDVAVREGERYVYRLRSVDFDGTTHDYEQTVEVEATRMIRDYELMQNYPNPFNPSTTIRYALPVASEVSLRVYDMLGRMVSEVLGSVKQEAGVYEVRFEARGLSSGVYFYRLEATSAQRRFVETKKMLLIK
ncbi:MAG: T9SS type A sorting domain-containing protein, partial [Candidatus Thermochlorobacter sp.]